VVGVWGLGFGGWGGAFTQRLVALNASTYAPASVRELGVVTYSSPCL